MAIKQKIRRIYGKYRFLIWGLVIILSTLFYLNFDKLNSMTIVPMSVWQYGGAGITLGIVIMLLSIAIGVALIASGIFLPGGIIILLGGFVWGAKVAGYSLLIGMVFDFFSRYKFFLLIAGAILIGLWLTRSKYSYSYGGNVSSDWYSRSGAGWRKR